MPTPEILVVLSTFPDEASAAQVGRALVEEGLVACAQIELAAIRSIYRWQETLQDEREYLLRLKSAPQRRGALIERLTALHPYEVPQIVILPATASAPYAAWLRIQCGIEDTTRG